MRIIFIFYISLYILFYVLLLIYKECVHCVCGIITFSITKPKYIIIVFFLYKMKKVKFKKRRPEDVLDVFGASYIH